MLTHIVLFTLKDKNDAAEALTRLRDLPSQIPSLISLRCGENAVAKPNSWDLALMTEHADDEGLQQYAEHPAHKAVVDWLSSRVSGRAVVDSVDFR